MESQLPVSNLVESGKIIEIKSDSNDFRNLLLKYFNNQSFTLHDYSVYTYVPFSSYKYEHLSERISLDSRLKKNFFSHFVNESKECGKYERNFAATLYELS